MSPAWLYVDLILSVSPQLPWLYIEWHFREFCLYGRNLMSLYACLIPLETSRLCPSFSWLVVLYTINKTCLQSFLCLTRFFSPPGYFWLWISWYSDYLMLNVHQFTSSFSLDWNGTLRLIRWVFLCLRTCFYTSQVDTEAWGIYRQNISLKLVLLVSINESLSLVSILGVEKLRVQINHSFTPWAYSSKISSLVKYAEENLSKRSVHKHRNLSKCEEKEGKIETFTSE